MAGMEVYVFPHNGEGGKLEQGSIKRFDRRTGEEQEVLTQSQLGYLVEGFGRVPIMFDIGRDDEPYAAGVYRIPISAYEPGGFGSGLNIKRFGWRLERVGNLPKQEG